MKFTQLLNESYYKTQKSSSTSPIEIFIKSISCKDCTLLLLNDY